MNTPPLYIPPSQAEEITGIHKTQLASLAKSGIIEHIKTPAGRDRYLTTSIAMLPFRVSRSVVYYVEEEPINAELARRVIENWKLTTTRRQNAVGEPFGYIGEKRYDLAKPLPERDGFKEIALLYREAMINSYICVSEYMIHDDAMTLTWVSMCAMLGLYCYVARGDTLIPYPYDVFEYVIHLKGFAKQSKLRKVIR